MATRIPLAWVVLVVIVGIFAFFGYHIIKASNSPRLLDPIVNPQLQAAINAAKGLPTMNIAHVQPTQDFSVPVQPYVPPPPVEPVQVQAVDAAVHGPETAAPVMTTRQRPPVAKPMPVPVGMTEEDMRLPEPLQRTPPAVHYDNPEATDPFNRVAFMDAEFGSNLRHPEQMIEQRQKPGVGRIVPSGLGSERSSPGPHNAVGYSPEMLQNGGEFMQGVEAFDGAGMNTSFSMV